MARFISPPINQLSKLRQPLTIGERLVFEFFHDQLPSEWEIYIQPHLNGLRPDFVLLNPKSGIAVFEVKDWNLNAMEYFSKSIPGNPPELYAKKDGKTFSIQRQNPVNQIYRYKQELFELYCPRLDKKAGFAVITAGVIFPFAKDEEAKKLLSPFLDSFNMNKYPQYNPISGMDSIQAGNIEEVFPESLRKYSKYMNKDLANDLRNWLVEPDFSATQRRPLILDNKQLGLVKSRTSSGYRRIKGPAGSGKSLILAARAAELLGEGKEILVITYNITLLHYLMDIAVRWPASSGKTRENITWLNFHYWCKRVCQESGYEKEYKELWRKLPSNGEDLNQRLANDPAVKDILNVKLPSLISKVIEQDIAENIYRYDVVLVDEGQDFRLSWWNVLRKICRKNGEMLLVADATQDIYGTARSWTDEAMLGAGFLRVKWSELKISYRLPPLALKLARSFAERFLPNDTVDLPELAQEELNIYPCKLKWIHTSPERAIDVCVKEILSMAPNAEPELLSISDITFLCGTHKFGYNVVEKLATKGVKVVHTFSDDNKESHSLKLGFYMGDSRIKATTIHSFKGWESRALVIYIGKYVDNNSLALIYTGLTRLKRHTEHSYLTIVSCTDNLKNFGKTWPIYEEL